ncbi:hypothetical protein Tco_0570764 [Tanacetum coccineum]
MKVEESLNVKFDETPPPNSPPLVDDDLLEVDIIENQSKDLEVKENEPLNKQISNIKESKDQLLETVIGNLNQRTLRSQVIFTINKRLIPPRPSFATIECLANEPPPIPPMDSTFPLSTPELEPTPPPIPPQCLPPPPSQLTPLFFLPQLGTNNPFL